MQLAQIILSELQDFDTPNPNQVRELRKALNISTQNAADLIGISKRTWERYESGDSQMKSHCWFYLTLIAGTNHKIKLLSFGE